MSMEIEKYAEELYTTYCAAVGGVAFNGDPLPTWADFRCDPAKAKQVAAWRTLAAEVRGAIIVGIQNHPDRLRTLFTMQADLNKRCGVDTANMTDEQRVHWLLQFTRAMQQEVAELVDSVPWKWWAKYQTTDMQNARVEIVDMLHFLISLSQVVGMDSTELYNAYLAKHQVNHARQDSGYAVKTEDTKHI